MTNEAVPWEYKDGYPLERPVNPVLYNSSY